MPIQKTIAVEIRGLQGRVTQGTVEHLAWERKERTVRGLKAWGMTWGVALCAVLIPILHFILVPTLLIAGPILFYVVANQSEVIAGGAGECPDCGKPFRIAKTGVKWPISELCDQCRGPLKVAPAAG